MANTLGIKTQIESIGSIAKITKAMELVSTAKLKKISKIAWQIKEYSSEVYTIFNDIIKKTTDSEYLALENFKIKKTLWIIINSNIGLCGSYNLNVNKLVIKNMKEKDEVFAIGSRGKSYFTSRKKTVVYFQDIKINFSIEEAKKIALDLHDNFINKKYDSIKIGYTKFINSSSYVATILDILPIVKINNKIKESQKNSSKAFTAITEFDPSVDLIMKESIILYLSTIIYSAIIESQVSEHTARRIAMENATDNANDLKDKLVLEYNRKRQNGITQEILEIISGSEAQNKK